MLSCKNTAECPDILTGCALPVFTMDCETGEIDLAMCGCESKTSCQIESQIIMALFVRGRDESSSESCKGGWFGDTLSDSPIGSKNWSLYGKKINDELIRRVEQNVEEALQPLVTLGIIDAVTVNASQCGNDIVIDDILISRPDDITNFAYLWEAANV